MHYTAFTELLLLYVSVHVPATVNTAAVHAAPSVQKCLVVPYPLQKVSDVRMLITCVCVYTTEIQSVYISASLILMHFVPLLQRQ